MKDTASKVTALKNAANPPMSEAARWPLSFRIVPQPQQGLEAFGVSTTKEKPKKRWWSHLLYRGPNNERVKILYSKTKAHSEVLAKQFLGEKVIGFDMEWPWDDWKRPDKLQNKIGLIQVATEDKIALFHIGLHTGNTSDEILAPSLRKLIESPTIGKIGVGILNADFARLSRYFKLQPKGAVELSHLHRLVTFGARKPELVSTKMTSLANQVEQHLGHPLYKGSVRTSNWSKPLSQQQIKYAAGDAYAGIMLYHCLNYKRLQMNPTPPLPIHAEKYLAYKLSGVSSLYLEPSEEGGKIMTSAFFFGVPTAPEDLSSKSKKATTTSRTTSKFTAGARPATTTDASNMDTQSKVRRTVSKSFSLESLEPFSKALFYELIQWRSAVAAEVRLPEYRVLVDQTLVGLAEERPLDSQSLLKISGVGIKKEETYGKQIIKVISSFVSKNGFAGNVVEASSETSQKTPNISMESGTPTTPNYSSSRRKAVRPKTPDSSPAFVTAPSPRTPQLHTGLSFTLAQSKLVDQEDSDDSLPSLDFGLSPSSKRTSGHKRKRSESPKKLQQMIRNYRYDEGVSELQATAPPRKWSPRQEAPHQASKAKARLARPIRPTSPPLITCTTAAPLTPQSKIFHNKLVAFSRLVATKKQTKADHLISSETLEAVARNPPRTQDELRRMPGVEKFFLACVDTNVDLLAKIQKFAPG